MSKKAQVTIPLDIDDVRVIQTEITSRGELVITIKSTKEWAKCRLCGQRIEKFHGHDQWVMVRYLPVFGYETYLRYRPKRYQCGTCENRPTTTQQVEWHEPNSAHTVRYDNHVLLQLVNTTVEDVRRKENLCYDSVAGALERRIQGKVDWSAYTTLKVLGLDEIALKKGHRDFVVIVTTHLEDGRVAILGVLPNREKETVVAFLRSIPERLRWTIDTICCDMYDGYTEAVRKEVDTARIVIDRFHVAEKYRDGADNLRKQELKRLKKELSQEEFKNLEGQPVGISQKQCGYESRRTASATAVVLSFA
jgi:transposase